MLASKYNSDMRIYLLLLVPLLIWGCEQTYDNLIDTPKETFQVTLVSPSDSITFNRTDSLIIVRIVFTDESKVVEAEFDIISPEGTKLNPIPIRLFDNGNPENGDLSANDNRFANKFPMSQYYPIGNYQINYFVNDQNGLARRVAISSFYFKNGQDNLPPVISNTVIEPDTVVVNQPTVIFTSVDASDPNGLSDILEVYFIVYRPDGTSNNSKVMLFDDGNTSENGDLVAGDGTYSLLIQVDQSNQKGTYRFEFQARDRIGNLSNIINHFVLIQ